MEKQQYWDNGRFLLYHSWFRIRLEFPLNFAYDLPFNRPFPGYIGFRVLVLFTV